MGAIVTLACAAVLAISVLWAIVFKKHAVMRLVCVIIRAVIAFIGTLIAKSIILSSAKDLVKIVEQLLSKPEKAVTISEGLARTLLSLTASASSVIIFTVLYFALAFVMYLVRLIAVIMLRKKTKSGKRPKLLVRALCGFAQGFILLTCLMVPVSTYMSIADKTLTATESMNLEKKTDDSSTSQAGGAEQPAQAVTTSSIYLKTSEEAAVQSAEQSSAETPKKSNNTAKTVSAINNSLAFNTHRALGGSLISNTLSSVDVKIGETTYKTNLNKEADGISEMISKFMLLTSKKFANYTDEDVAAIGSLGESLTKSKFFYSLVSEAIGEATEAWSKGETYLGIPKISIEPTLDPMIQKSFSILGQDSDNPDLLSEDLSTFSKVLAKLIDGTRKTEGGNIKNALLADGMVKDVLTTINTNARMRPLIPSVTNIGLSMISDSLGIEQDSQAAYDKFTEAIALQLVSSASLEAAERRTNMENTITSELKRFGVNDIGASETSIIAQSLIAYFDSDGRTPAQATKEAVATFLSQTKSINESISSDADANAKALAAIEKLTADENKTAFKYTKKSILIGEDAINASISEQETGLIIDVVAEVFSNIKNITSGGESGIPKTVFDSLGMVLDKFAQTPTLYGPEKAEHFLKTVLYTGSVSEKSKISALDVDKMLDTRKTKNVSYTALMGTLYETANTFTSIGNGSALDASTAGALVDALTNEGSGAVISTVITPDKLAEHGFASKTEEQREQGASFLQSVFTNISEQQDQAQRDKEAAAVKSVIDIIGDTNKKDVPEGSNAFGEGGRLDCTADEFVNTMLASSSITKSLADNTLDNPFGVKLSDADKTATATSIKTKRDAAGTTEEEKAALNSLANLLGVTLS